MDTLSTYARCTIGVSVVKFTVKYAYKGYAEHAKCALGMQVVKIS